MEQYFHGSAHYVMWNLKSKFPYSTSKINSAFHEEEASGLMAAVSWPPRSYSCSFCQRDFRSAQALGGHMNVHRRDRAKLNQQNHNIKVPPKPDRPTFIDGDNCVETRLSVGINCSYGSNTVICKSSHNKMVTNPMEDDDREDIDLELRLGDSPTLK